jgi:hypothetical protein
VTVAACGGSPAKRPGADGAAGRDRITALEASQAVADFVDRAMEAFSVADTADAAAAEAGPITVDRPIDKTTSGSTGGQITVTGSLSGTINAPEQKMSLALDAKETIAAYQFEMSGVTYTVNGAPDVTAKGTLTMSGRDVPPAPHLTLTGTFTIARGGASRTCPLSVVVEPNPAGTQVFMTGTICGERVRRDL